MKAGDAFDQDRLTNVVRTHVTQAEPLSYAGGEISFRLPREQSSNFPRLFRELETRREAMGVGGYGVSVTSLEEVFLSLEKEGKRAGRDQTTLDSDSGLIAVGMIGPMKRSSSGPSRGDGALNAGDGSGSKGDGSLRHRRSTSGNNPDLQDSSNRSRSTESLSNSSSASPNGNGAWPAEESTDGVSEIEMQDMARANSRPRQEQDAKTRDENDAGRSRRSVTTGHKPRRIGADGGGGRGVETYPGEQQRLILGGAALLTEGQDDDGGFAFDIKEVMYFEEHVDTYTCTIDKYFVFVSANCHIGVYLLIPAVTGWRIV